MKHNSHLSLVVNKTKAEELWDAFLVAREKALDTCELEDGIAAGKAFGAFLRAVAEGRA